MGTRHLVAVVSDGAFKVAQYGQWDGYPSGQGLTALRFLREVDLEAFKSKADQCRALTPEEGKEIEAVKNWPAVYPHLSRDAGADVLNMVLNSESGLALSYSVEFAADSLFCEWAYVIDLDTGVFEVYKGFQRKDREGEVQGRFKDLPPDNEDYLPVGLYRTYRLTSLPTDEDFLAKLEPEGDDVEPIPEWKEPPVVNLLTPQRALVL